MGLSGGGGVPGQVGWRIGSSRQSMPSFTLFSLAFMKMLLHPIFSICEVS
jgi:hypothetical protein